LLNRPYMKRLKNGRFARLTLVAIALTFPWPSWAVERRAWVNEQISHTLYRQAKDHQVSLFGSAGQYLDSLNGLASLGYDPGPVEARGFIGGRYFFEWRPEGRAEKRALLNEQFFYGGEIGRSFYGREMGAIRLGWLHYPDAVLAYATIGIETANRLGKDIPWLYRFQLNYWINALGTLSRMRGNWIHLGLDLDHTLSDNFAGASSIGVHVSWSYRSTDVTALGVGRYELMQIGVAPTVNWQGSTGRWSVSIPLRMFLDAEVATGKSLTHPSVLGAPGLEVKWGPR